MFGRKKLDLCGSCAAKIGSFVTLTMLPKPSNNKITCAECGRRRYGATYIAERRKAAEK